MSTPRTTHAEQVRAQFQTIADSFNALNLVTPNPEINLDPNYLAGLRQSTASVITNAKHLCDDRAQRMDSLQKDIDKLAAQNQKWQTEIDDANRAISNPSDKDHPGSTEIIQQEYEAHKDNPLEVDADLIATHQQRIEDKKALIEDRQESIRKNTGKITTATTQKDKLADEADEARSLADESVDIRRQLVTEGKVDAEQLKKFTTNSQKMGKTNWGRKLGTAALCFAGVIACGAAIALSAGAAAPIIAAGAAGVANALGFFGVSASATLGAQITTGAAAGSVGLPGIKALKNALEREDQDFKATEVQESGARFADTAGNPQVKSHEESAPSPAEDAKETDPLLGADSSPRSSTAGDNPFADLPPGDGLPGQQRTGRPKPPPPAESKADYDARKARERAAGEGARTPTARGSDRDRPPTPEQEQQQRQQQQEQQQQQPPPSTNPFDY